MERKIWKIVYGLNNYINHFDNNVNFSCKKPSLKASLSVKNMQANYFVCAQMLSHVWFFVTPWTVAHQAPLSMEFSRQEYWSGLPFPSSRDLPNPGIKPTALESPALQVESLLLSRLFQLWCLWSICAEVSHLPPCSRYWLYLYWYLIS